MTVVLSALRMIPSALDFGFGAAFGSGEETGALSALSHSRSPAVSLSENRNANMTNIEDSPSQCCGSPYFPLTGLCLCRRSHSASGMEFFRVLHFQHDVRRFSLSLGPPV